jgi:hypothetical protein
MEKDFVAFLDQLKTRLEIDKFSLEDEAAQQPVLLEEVGRSMVEAKSLFKSCKDELEVSLAKIRIDVCKNPGNYGFDKKPSEDTVSAICVEKTQDLMQALRLFEEQASALEIVYNAVEQRKTLITQAVNLFVHDYYSGKPLVAEQAALSTQGIDAIKAFRQRKHQEQMEQTSSEAQ